MEYVRFEPITSDHKELSSISNKLQALLRLKEREKQEEAIIQLEDIQRSLQKRLNASGCITSGKSKIDIIGPVSKTMEI